MIVFNSSYKKFLTDEKFHSNFLRMATLLKGFLFCALWSIFLFESFTFLYFSYLIKSQNYIKSFLTIEYHIWSILKNFIFFDFWQELVEETSWSDISPKKKYILGPVWGPKPKPKTKINSEFNSLHFCIEINKRLKFLTLVSFWV